MPDAIALEVNGRQISVPHGTTVAVAVMVAGEPCRTSVSGQPRAALCGMGICFECRVTINGIPHCRSCQIRCEPGMKVSSEV